MSYSRCAAVVVCVVFAVIGWVAATESNLSAGSISATPGPLCDGEPRIALNRQNTPGDASATFVIRGPGSYYLAAPLIGEAGKAGIDIAASHVTLDLRGFDLLGVPAALSGVRVRGPQTNITVRDGTLRDWPAIGIDLSEAPYSTLEDLRANGNDAGIFVANRCTVRRCVATDNAGGGILTGQSSTIQGCAAFFNGANGIYTLEASRIDGCTVEGNNGHGLYLDGDGCAVTNCVAVANALNGITSIYGASISASTAEDNGNDGMWSLGVVTFTQCRCTANVGDGIEAGDDSTLTQCTAFANGADGLRLGLRVSASDNHAADQRKGAGIHAVGGAARIQGNTLIGNAVGVRVEGTGSLIVRNTASNSIAQAFDIAPGNAHGPIINVAGAGDLGALAGADHPLANLVH